RNPLFASFVVIAQPQSLAASAAAGDLAKRLLEAGGAALVVAMLLILLVSRSMTRPLTQLASAAEDIAAGNYARRVSIKGQDELGLLGSAFNRMAEAVERARKAQRDFLANVSHELKTPLTSLIGFSQALVDGSLLSDVERTRAASIVHEESERVLRMAQELHNLLDNAVKYAPEGAIVNAVARLSGGSVEAVVSNAVGSHRPDPDRMFDRFYRADPSRSAAAGGVGLGLAISRELVAAMKGRLWADFDETGNLRVHLTLPAARQMAKKAEPAGPAAGA